MYMECCISCCPLHVCVFCKAINPESYYKFTGKYTICNWHFKGISNSEAIILINRCMKKNNNDLSMSLDEMIISD